MARKRWEDDSLLSRQNAKKSDLASLNAYLRGTQSDVQKQRAKGEMGETMARGAGKLIGGIGGFFLGGPGGAKAGAAAGDFLAGGAYDLVDQRSEAKMDARGFRHRSGIEGLGGTSNAQVLTDQISKVNTALDKLDQSANTRHLTSPIKAYMQADQIGKSIHGSKKWSEMGVSDAPHKKGQGFGEWVKSWGNKGIDPTTDGKVTSATENVYKSDYKFPSNKEMAQDLYIGQKPTTPLENINAAKGSQLPYQMDPTSTKAPLGQSRPSVYDQISSRQAARNQQMVDMQNRLFSPQQQEFQMNQQIQMNEMQKNYRTQLNKIQNYSDKQTNINKEPVLNSKNDTISSKIENEVIYNQNEPLFDSDTTKIDDPTQVPTINLDNAPGLNEFKDTYNKVLGEKGAPFMPFSELKDGDYSYQYVTNLMLMDIYGSANLNGISHLMSQGSNWETRMYAKYPDEAAGIIRMIRNLEKSGEISLSKLK